MDFQYVVELKPYTLYSLYCKCGCNALCLCTKEENNVVNDTDNYTTESFTIDCIHVFDCMFYLFLKGFKPDNTIICFNKIS